MKNYDVNDNPSSRFHVSFVFGKWIKLKKKLILCYILEVII